MRAIIWVALVLPACELANSAEPVAPMPPAKPIVVETPAPAKPLVAPPKIAPPTTPEELADELTDEVDTRTSNQRPRFVPVAPGLPPSPITDATVYDPAAYEAWLGALSPAQRKQVAAICRKETTDFRPECDGIGVLHIPVPPFLRAVRDPAPYSPFASYAQWEFVISPAQHHYIETHCNGGESAPSSDLCGENTPLVIAFDDQPVVFAAGARFAFAPGSPVATDLPTAATPWLALDRDGDGRITSGAELFGDRTVLPDGRRAAHGFEALAALDANHDGQIDAADPAFASLVLWAGDELRPAAGVVTSISLAYRRDVRCDARDNCEGERASIRWRDARGDHAGAIVDVYLPTR